MKKLREILETKVDPLFFVFTCAMLILFSITAQILVQQIANESDRGAELFRVAHLSY
jgi:hypothetical protein